MAIHVFMVLDMRMGIAKNTGQRNVVYRHSLCISEREMSVRRKKGMCTEDLTQKMKREVE